MKPGFLTQEKPPLTCMLQADRPQRIHELFVKASADGAEAFGMQFCHMKTEYRVAETYRTLLSLADMAPIYVTNYRYGENQNKTDETLATELLELADCGATLCDVMGDFFAPCEDQLTGEEEAVRKQKKLIDALHERGAEVVMSSHVFHFLPAEEVLKMAREHQRRGADICKIVTGAANMAEQIENLRTIQLLKEQLGIPFLLLSVGECHLLRRVGETLGNCMTLCVYEYDDFATKLQPLLSDMKTLRKLL